MHWKSARTTLGVALLLAAGGCGESKPLTTAELVKQANAICAKTHAQEASLLQVVSAQVRAQHLSQAQARARVVPRWTALERERLHQLEGLKPLDEMKASYTKWKQDILTEITHFGESEESSSSAAHARLVAVAEQRERLKRELGLEQC